jgi:hypothetical protein
MGSHECFIRLIKIDDDVAASLCGTTLPMPARRSVKAGQHRRRNNDECKIHSTLRLLLRHPDAIASFCKNVPEFSSQRNIVYPVEQRRARSR